MILLTNEVAKSHLFWDQFKTRLCDDVKHKLCYMSYYQADQEIPENNIHNYGLWDLNRIVTNFIWPYLHQVFNDSHGLKGYGKPLKRPFNRYQSHLEAISIDQDRETGYDVNSPPSRQDLLSIIEEHFWSNFYPHTSSAEIGMLCSLLPPSHACHQKKQQYCHL